ncbi:helicase associated domain-containing protein [Nakamurella alba]
MEHGFRPDDEKWAAQLERLAHHMRTHGLPPSTSAGTDAAERRLGYWLSTQRREERLRTLLPHRREQLDQAVPGWRTHHTMWA